MKHLGFGSQMLLILRRLQDLLPTDWQPSFRARKSPQRLLCVKPYVPFSLYVPNIRADLYFKGRIAATPFMIAVSPVTLILSIFTLVSFGFYIAMNAITPVFLQKPIKIGGYGFTTYQNACCMSYLTEP